MILPSEWILGHVDYVNKTVQDNDNFFTAWPAGSSLGYLCNSVDSLGSHHSDLQSAAFVALWRHNTGKML